MSPYQIIAIMNKTELETLQQDCEFKTRNLNTAFQSASTNGFNSVWMMNNLLSCIKESETSVTALIQYLENNKA